MTNTSSMPSASSSPAYSMLWASVPGQEKLITELWREGGLGSSVSSEHDLARLRWFYLDNPQGVAQINLLGFGVDKLPVGSLAIAPRLVLIDGEAFTGGTLVDFVVNPRHRSAYPALTLQRTGRERALRNWDFVYGLPDTKAVAICKRLTTHVSFQLPRFVRVIRSRSYLVRVLPVLLATTLSWFVDATDRAVTRMRLLVSPNRGEWLRGFDGSFDSLWASLEKQSLCIGMRDSAFLRWRFGAQPQHAYQTFAVRRPDDNGLRMYFVCERSAHALTVKDCLNVGSESELTHGLLLLISAARKLGVNSVDIQIMADSTWAQALKRTHFSLRSQRPFFATFREPLQQKAEGCHWYITQADEDI